MTDLPAASQTAIIAMIDAAPDAALKTLSVALRSTPGARVEWIRGRILLEMDDRRMRDAAFGPLIALFRPRPDGVRGLTFPMIILKGLWKEVRRRQPQLLAQADEMTVGGGEIDPLLLDQLCLSAAALLRDEPGKAWVGLDPATAGSLASCFDLAPLARRGLPMLRAWTGRPDPEADAALRLMMRDAAQISDDAEPRMLEILFANIEQPGLILRVASRMSGAGGDGRLLAESEMADFGERLLEQIEAAADVLSALDPASDDLAQVRAAAKRLDGAADLMGQMELSLDLTPEGAWGERFQGVKQRMGRTLGDLMGRCPRVVANALPMERKRVAGGVARMVPIMDARTDGPVIDQARRLLELLALTRQAALTLGCTGQRNQVCETLEKHLSAYGDEMVEALNAGGGAREEGMIALAELCAAFLEQADAEIPARTLRRRLAAAGATAAPSPQAA